MTDRELLELAAKAAGYVVEFKRWSGLDRTGILSWRGIWLSGEQAFIGTQGWNPLEDDGDALRLAVTLHMGLDCYFAADHVEHCCAWVNHRDTYGFYRAYEPYGDNPEKATRRAIVAVAAEIGKAMP